MNRGLCLKSALLNENLNKKPQQSPAVQKDWKLLCKTQQTHWCSFVVAFYWSWEIGTSLEVTDQAQHYFLVIGVTKFFSLAVKIYGKGSYHNLSCCTGCWAFLGSSKLSFMWILWDRDSKAMCCFKYSTSTSSDLMEIGHELLLLNLSALRELKEQNSGAGSFVIKNKKVVGSRDCIWAAWLCWTALGLTVWQMCSVGS